MITGPSRFGGKSSLWSGNAVFGSDKTISSEKLHSTLRAIFAIVDFPLSFSRILLRDSGIFFFMSLGSNVPSRLRRFSKSEAKGLHRRKGTGA